jgi:hypothetical protein
METNNKPLQLLQNVANLGVTCLRSLPVKPFKQYKVVTGMPFI